MSSWAVGYRLLYVCAHTHITKKNPIIINIVPFWREPDLVLLDVQSVPAGQEGWLAFDVTTASNHWLLNPRSNLGIRLYVETEEGGSSPSRFALQERPYHRRSPFCLSPSQIAPCLPDGSGWWVAGVLGPNSPSWWPSSGRTRSPVDRRELLSLILGERNLNMTSQSPAFKVRFCVLCSGVSFPDFQL